MAPRACGRHCSSCDKLVYDFTGLTDEALHEVISNNKGSICGRFFTCQLNKPIYIPRTVKKAGFSRLAASLLAMISLSSFLPANAQKASGKGFRMEQGPGSSKPALLEDSLKFCIYGFVSDSTAAKPLANASILVDNKVVAVTDLNGRYSFILPSGYKQPIVEVTAEKIGSHQPVTDILRLKTLPAELNFILSTYECKSTVIITAGVLSIRAVDDKNKTISKRKPWYQKILGKRAGE